MIRITHLHDAIVIETDDKSCPLSFEDALRALENAGFAPDFIAQLLSQKHEAMVSLVAGMPHLELSPQELSTMPWRSDVPEDL